PAPTFSFLDSYISLLSSSPPILFSFLFFFTATATTEIYTLSLHDALPISHKWLYQPLDCGMLLFRSAHAARTAFCCSGDYAKSLAGPAGVVRVLRRIARAVTALPGVEVMVVAALPRAGGVSQRDPQRPATCAESRRAHPRHGEARAARARRAQRRVLPLPLGRAGCRS